MTFRTVFKKLGIDSEDASLTKEKNPCVKAEELRRRVSYNCYTHLGDGVLNFNNKECANLQKEIAKAEEECNQFNRPGFSK